MGSQPRGGGDGTRNFSSSKSSPSSKWWNSLVSSLYTSGMVSSLNLVGTSAATCQPTVATQRRAHAQSWLISRSIPPLLKRSIRHVCTRLLRTGRAWECGGMLLTLPMLPSPIMTILACGHSWLMLAALLFGVVPREMCTPWLPVGGGGPPGWSGFTFFATEVGLYSCRSIGRSRSRNSNSYAENELFEEHPKFSPFGCKLVLRMR